VLGVIPFRRQAYRQKEVARGLAVDVYLQHGRAALSTNEQKDDEGSDPFWRNYEQDNSQVAQRSRWIDRLLRR
jgi:hypothetical protein